MIRRVGATKRPPPSFRAGFMLGRRTKLKRTGWPGWLRRSSAESPVRSPVRSLVRHFRPTNSLDRTQGLQEFLYSLPGHLCVRTCVLKSVGSADIEFSRHRSGGFGVWFWHRAFMCRSEKNLPTVGDSTHLVVSNRVGCYMFCFVFLEQLHSLSLNTNQGNFTSLITTKL